VHELAASLRDQFETEWSADGLQQSVADVHDVATDLRDELARLAAFRRALSDGYPAVARAVEHASVQAASRFSELSRAVEALPGRVNGQAATEVEPAGSDHDDEDDVSRWS
jgi:hypothetical protein